MYLLRITTSNPSDEEKASVWADFKLDVVATAMTMIALSIGNRVLVCRYISILLNLIGKCVALELVHIITI